MLSESARATSAAESQFRVVGANSLPRAVTVVALDQASEAVVGRLRASQPGHRARLLSATSTGDVLDEITPADLVVLVATAGEETPEVAGIGRVCRRRGVTITSLVMERPSADRERRARTLARLRPWSTMVVSTSSARYLDDLLTALRA